MDAPSAVGQHDTPRLLIVLTFLCDLALALMYALQGPLLLDFVGLVPRCASLDPYVGVCLALAGLHLAAAGGVVASRRWGRHLQVAACGINALFPWWVEFPLGVLWVPLVFWTVPAALMGAYWLLRPKGWPLISVTVASAFAATVAALMLAFVRPHIDRPAWSATAIGDLRTLASAEEAYKNANSGFYGSPECLAEPRRCLPASVGHPPTPFLLAGDLNRYGGVWTAYRRTFYPGREAVGGLVPGARLASFACTASPVMIDGKQWSGCYSFCVDSTGTICAAPAGAEPKVIDGRCDLSTCKSTP